MKRWTSEEMRQEIIRTLAQDYGITQEQAAQMYADLKPVIIASEAKAYLKQKGWVVMFKVQRRMCATCIYRPDSTLSLKKLEADVADPHMKGYFKGHRICHHSKDVCCRGFWDKHKDDFTAGQLAQRLKLVQFVDVDTLKEKA